MKSMSWESRRQKRLAQLRARIDGTPQPPPSTHSEREYGATGWHFVRVPHDPFTGAPLSHEPDIDAALARAGLSRPVHVPLQEWLSHLSEET